MLSKDINPAKSVKSGVDLNNLVHVGKYYLPPNNTCLNTPEQATEMTVSVENISNVIGRRFLQTAIVYASSDKPRIYMRCIDNSGNGLYPNLGTTSGKAWQRLLSYNSNNVYADNASAKTGGLVAGDTYRTSTGQLMIVY